MLHCRVLLLTPELTNNGAGVRLQGADRPQEEGQQEEADNVQPPAVDKGPEAEEQVAGSEQTE